MYTIWQSSLSNKVKWLDNLLKYIAVYVNYGSFNVFALHYTLNVVL
jgi:hypothetical protein